ncbi:UDP-N-acetylglucosamine/UDP-glucose/GDP-mannose transporter [Heracleum sosnowskyi]|uniref:UDP-N-acetylglucosamine/UDP-glucose/GDP-mannose transporter n=1 Tax=Heracleum sosnowskyi TaxID=360622 RepID=A0AAD8HPW2_9APIA|nr:UDP-N-acetylglucosamine/UDP-glucose/GDP-mannose transporter [Heracleum sosnowskyi]
MATLNSSEKVPILPVSDPPPPTRRSPMTPRGVYAALSYMTCAVLLVLFNKAALSSYKFPCANVITLFQMISSTSFLYALRRRKLISFSVGESLAGTDASTKLVPVKTLIHTLPLALSYLLYMIVSMESIRGVNVPMYTTLRRTTVVFTMLVEYFLAGQKYTSSILVSVSMIVLGAFIAGARDLSFDSYGYGVVFLSNISTAIYLATISRLGKSSGLNSFGLMWCNGIMCAPLLFFWTLIRGDLEITMNFQYLLSPGFMLVILLSCILAFFLNYSIFLNTTLNSAVTQTICGNLKDFFTIALGWIFFGGLPFDILNVIGQVFGFLGSGLYAYFKLIGQVTNHVLKFVIVPVQGDSVAASKVYSHVIIYDIWEV